jgi:hypothetical protein
LIFKEEAKTDEHDSTDDECKRFWQEVKGVDVISENQCTYYHDAGQTAF